MSYGFAHWDDRRRGRARRALGAAASALLLAWTLAAPHAARAQEIAAACSGGVGNAKSLVEAIRKADETPATPDTVVLGAGCTYTLTSAENSWYGPNGLPPISSPITIVGHGARIARSAAAKTPPFRLFFVGADPEAPATQGYVSPGAGALTLRELVLEGGLAQGGSSSGGGGGAGLGGAIFSEGTLTIEGCTITGNHAVGGSAEDATAGRGGGGIGQAAPHEAPSGGGFGPLGSFGGAEGGAPGEEAAGGGAGFGALESGHAGEGTKGGAGGGAVTGLGGAGSGIEGVPGGEGGDGSGGGASGVPAPGAGGGFGAGGAANGGGGGVGGGGAAEGGAGGFGGGGGAGAAGRAGGGGGFGGGGGGGEGAAGGGFGGGAGGLEGGGGGAGMGGAIFDLRGTLAVLDSTLAANSALGGEAKQRGEGIAGAIFDLNGIFTSTGSTFAGNEAPNRASQVYTLALEESEAREAGTTLTDTIVAGGNEGVVELDSAEVGLGIAHSDVSQFDLVRGLGKGATVHGEPISQDPLLGPLQDNGGPTPTMAPGEGSPAIDAGKAFALAADQRGQARPVDFAEVPNAAGGDGSDIGAFEVQSQCASAALKPFTQCPAEPAPKGGPPPPGGEPERQPSPAPKSPGTLSAIAKQKLGAVVVASFLCKAAICTVTITIDISYGGRRLHLGLKAKRVPAGRKQRFAVPLPKRDRKLLAKALAHHKRVIADVTALVSYAEGRAKAGPLGIRLVR